MAISTEEVRDIIVNNIGLTDEHWQTFLSRVKIRSLKRKEFLVKAGTVCNIIGLVNSGVLRSFVTGNGEEHNTDFYFPYCLVSAYSSFVTLLPSDHSIQALSATEVWCLALPDYDELVSADPVWLRFGKYAADFFLVRKCRREISFLKQSATERYAGMIKEYPDIEQRIPQYHIASYLGIKPESLSRIKLADFTKSK